MIAGVGAETRAGCPSQVLADPASGGAEPILEEPSGGISTNNGTGGVAAELVSLAASVRRWPVATKAAVLALVCLYLPVVYEVSRMWLRDDSLAHGLFILPVCLFILWLNRSSLSESRMAPSTWGLIPLAIGLALETFSYLVQIKLVALFSLIPTLIGAVLVLH